MLPSRNFKDDLKALPTFAPLFAAVIAPLSTLYDIPALTEHWFYQHNSSTGTTNALPDPHTNITLSAVGLAFNVLANALLVVRFSVRDGLWRYSTRISLLCWFVKFSIALANVLAYGILTRNTPGISYGEGFWCAVMSLLLVFVILALLICHYMVQVRGSAGMPATENQLQMRIAGRHFMLQNTLFIMTIGLLALFMSQVEDWTYLEGIYFSVVSILTVGFGDFYPTKPVSQIVLFPFALIGIVQLASIIDLMVRFFHARLASQHAERRREFENQRHKEEIALEKEPDLEREVQFLTGLYNETRRWKTTQDLATSAAGFLLFWLLGALVFSELESWTYGQGLYFCYVFFFTIGYGDYTPITAAGRVVFIVYSIIAVPIMASFAVQAIQNVFQKFSIDLLKRNQARAGLGEAGAEEKVTGNRREAENSEDQEKRLPQDVQERLKKNDDGPRIKKSHTDILEERHEWIQSKLILRDAGQSETKEGGDDEDAEDADEREREREREEDRILTEYILELAVELESHARKLLLGHMKEGSSARILLKADRIVQLRNIKALALREGANQPNPEGGGSDRTQSVTPVPGRETRKGIVNTMMQKYYEDEVDLVNVPTDLDEKQTLEEVAHYREAFAGILATGSRLLGLKGQEKVMFERRYWSGRKEDK